MNQSKQATEMATLRERDRILEHFWAELEDVPMDPDTEGLEAPFLHFPVGTQREDIWHWFDQRHSKGVVYLLYSHDPLYPTPAKEKHEGICPICGTRIQYDGEYEILDNGGVIAWRCPNCGATGKEGYDHVFDRHYNVCSAEGEPVAE